jgi:hypothetical protein
MCWSLLAPGSLAVAETSAEDGAARGAAKAARANIEQQSRMLWKDLRAALRRGDYHAARQALDRLAELSPDDPNLPLYQSLIQSREEAPSPFGQLTAPELKDLKTRLEAEERAHKKKSDELKALNRQIEREQKEWDEELKRQSRRADTEAKAQQRAKAEEERRARREETARKKDVETAAAREDNETERPAAPRPEPPETPSPSGEPAAPAPARQETAPETEPPAGVPDRPITPLSQRPRPPSGAVQINADQMSARPERHLAIAEGNVEVLFEDAVLTCDRMTLFTDTKDIYAEGRVRLEEGTQVFRGEMVHYNLETKKGRFLQGTVSTPPWHQHGRTVEHIAEGVYRVTPGYLTSCDHEPPHFKFAGRRVTVFAEDRLARAQNVALFVERIPFLYLPWLSFADRRSPFFIIPGKRKPWGEFALMGYRYELPGIPGLSQKGTAKLDWRHAFGWGMGVDHQVESEQFGEGLLKLYYNDVGDRTTVDTARVNGAEGRRYRALWRHRWNPRPDTTVITDLQEYSDEHFRRDFLFREEFTDEDVPESFISMVTNDPNYTLSAVARKRLNRFQSVDEALPQVTVDARQQRIGDTQLFSESRFDAGNFQGTTRHSETDRDVVRADWFQQLTYALSWFRPIEVTPRAGVRQTYYTKDSRNDLVPAREHAEDDVVSGQVNTGGDASLKLFRVFPVQTNAMGLNINQLRHVVTPTVGYTYVHEPTIDNDLLNFPSASAPSNQMTLGLENKLQTRRSDGKRWSSVDLARFLISVPYVFHSSGNKDGSRLEDWAFDLEVYPWPWMRMESDWNVEAADYDNRVNDQRASRWNLDLIVVGGEGLLDAQRAPKISAPAAPTLRAFEPGSQVGRTLLPAGQWYLGLGHRYSRNDKVEDVVELNWRVSQKWEIGTFHRFTWKEIVDTSKRLNNMREYQYTLRRDLHDWIAELAYRVDRDFGEELFLTLTLKAFPDIPIETETSYHEPKQGSQTSPFFRLR